MHDAVHSANEYCENGTYKLHDQEEKKIMPGETAQESGLTAQ